MSSYEEQFRSALGFANQQRLKKYFKATDLVVINWDKIEQNNQRLIDMCKRINGALSPDIQLEDINAVEVKLKDAYNIMRENNIFPHLNNQGRTPDNVYYNWMRGYMMCELFVPALSKLFGVPTENIRQTGQDDLTNIETFSRAATADLEVIFPDSRRVRLEMQAGFTGVNDIKGSKIDEAVNLKKSSGIDTYVVHIDVFNGKAAIIDISIADISTLNFHKAFENTNVISIEPYQFRWKLADPLPSLEDVLIQL